MMYSFPCAVFLALAVAAPASGGQADEQPLTLERCIATAFARNPRVLASRDWHRAALARVNQARALPQPEFNLDSDLQPHPFHFAGSDERYVGFVQAIEFPGKRSVRGAMAMAEAGQTEADGDLLRLELAYDVTEAFNGLLLVEERLRYAKEDQRLSQEFLSQTTLKHEAGDVAQVEVLRAQLEASQAEAAVRVAANDVTLGKARLNFLLARPEDGELEVVGALKQPAARLDVAALKQRALSARPELKRIQLSVERERLYGRQASLGYFPDVEVGLARHTFNGAPGTWDVTLSMSVPLFFWQPKKGEVAEAQANLAGAERELEHLHHAIALEVEQAYRKTLTAQQQIDLFEREILKQAEETYQMFAFSYAEGEIGGLELIAARRTLLQARQSYAQALYDANLAVAALNKAVGQ
jgi:outer membrane protein TolC